MSPSDPLGLDEFLSESGDGQAASPSEPVVERVAEAEAAAPSPAEPPRADAANAVTLLALLEHRDAMDWREAVAVVRQLCVELKHSSSERPVMLDPRNILITAKGEVKVIPGPLGGDPLVIQIGRLLRTLLLNKPVPPEVRLILSQATFELPIFDSVDDVARALGQVSALQQIDGVGIAYARAVGPGEITPSNDVPKGLQAVPRPILPVPQRTGRRLLSRFRRQKDEVLLVATALVGTAACAALILTHWTSEDQSTPSPTSAAIGASSVDTLSTPGPVAADSARGAAPSTRAPVAPASRQPSQPTRAAATQPAATAERGTAAEPSARVSMPMATRPPEPAAVSPRDAAQRATALVAAGRSSEAEMAFDALVLNNPLYEPTRTEITPEAYAAFQASRRVVLPGIAIRDFGRAKEALAEGDVDRALVLASEVNAILDRAGPDGPPGLRGQVRALLGEILAARTAADELIYTSADAGIVAPRALSRQFPLAPPEGVRQDRVGVLEIVVGKLGDVEFVKLHTPLNRYHERMVVSAAKAWRYLPASKDGRPVKYRLTVTINLPESGGTD